MSADVMTAPSTTAASTTATASTRPEIVADDDRDLRHPADLTARQRISVERAARTTTLLREAKATEDPARRQDLLDRVVVDHIAVARSLAGRYRGKGIDLDDLTQVAYLGLVKAVAGCDPDRCDEFLQYAVPTILGELKRHFRDRGWAVRPTRRIQELHAAVGAARADLIQRLGREPNEAEISELVGADQASVREAGQAGQYLRVASLDALTDNGVPFDEKLDSGTDPREWIEDCMILQPAVSQLSERERRLVGLRFVDGRTQAQIGEELGLSQMHISRLLRDVLTKLRAAIGDKPVAV